MTIKRRFSTYGSCNETRFLQDPTGNTRYWVIESSLEKGEKIDIDQLKAERDGILSMAVKLYREGFDTELEVDEVKVNEDHNAMFVEDAAYVEDLAIALEDRTCTNMQEVFKILDMGSTVKAQRQITNQVKLSLAQLGWFQLKSPRNIKLNDGSKKSVKVWVLDENDYQTEEVQKFLDGSTDESF